jgi:hypothetical protein
MHQQTPTVRRVRSLWSQSARTNAIEILPLGTLRHITGSLKSAEQYCTATVMHSEAIPVQKSRWGKLLLIRLVSSDLILGGCWTTLKLWARTGPTIRHGSRFLTGNMFRSVSLGAMFTRHAISPVGVVDCATFPQRPVQSDSTNRAFAWRRGAVRQPAGSGEARN